MVTCAGATALSCALALPAVAQVWSVGGPIRKPERLTTAAQWKGLSERRWAGPAMWCNRLQDWIVRDGKLIAESAERLPCRTAHLLTYQLENRPEPFQLRTVVRAARRSEQAGFAGFLIGAGEGRLDYRGAALVHYFPGKGGGILAVLEGESGRLVFRDMSAETNAAEYPLLADQRTVDPARIDLTAQAISLDLEGVPSGQGKYDLHLAAWETESSRLLGAAELRGIDAARLLGNVALVSHSAGLDVVHEFESFEAGGGRLAHHPEQTFGPVAGTLYSVSNGILKLSAQFVPLGMKVTASAPPVAAGTNRAGGRTGNVRFLASLEITTAEGKWRVVDGPKPVIGPDFYVPFRVEKWDATREAKTRVVFEDIDGTRYEYPTRVTRDPTDKPTVSIAGFTGMGAMGRVASFSGPTPGPGEIVIGRWTPANVWTPFADAVRVVGKQGVDVLFFTGDQVYDTKPTRADDKIEPQEDYLYKWLLWHWSFRSLTNHLPAMVQPDDHDVFHGNIWGWGGRLNETGSNSDGGYLRSPYFVNMVHRTQTGHLPDPYDPVPALNGISNYYTHFTWGGVGFAVLEDRKFKTPPQVEDPAKQVLLGETQNRMLREWGEDWTNQQFKCVVSQTVYASLHVGFEGTVSADSDTGGFPKGRRDEAVRLFRRFGAFVLGGDQHLATFSQVGVEQATDGVYQFSVPALGNIFWRWFYPSKPGRNPLASGPDYTGEFADGFGNPFRMIAVANPERRSLLSQQLRNRSLIPAAEAASGLGDQIRASQGDGYGVVRFHKDTRRVTVECWPYLADPERGDKQYSGWPQSIAFDELDGRRPVAWLPDLDLSAAPGAVIQIQDQGTGEIVKITRAGAKSYSPGVFTAGGLYTLRAGQPERNRWWTAKDLKPSARRGERTLRVELR